MPMIIQCSLSAEDSVELTLNITLPILYCLKIVSAECVCFFFIKLLLFMCFTIISCK